jgi:LPS-assembly protein
MYKLPFAILVAFFFFICAVPQIAKAQVTKATPDRHYLYIEDKLKKEKKDRASIQAKAVEKKRKAYQKLQASGQAPFNINARDIKYDQDNNRVIGDGGIVINYSSLVIEATQGVVDLASNEAEVSGDVRMSDLGSSIVGDAARFDLDLGTGIIKNADLDFADGGYQINAKTAERRTGDSYSLTDATFTTCTCPEGDETCPWRISASKAEITRNGYGQANNAFFEIRNFPVLYLPYLIFPAKTERQTGFLNPSFGQSNQNGFQLVLPFFWDISPSTDMTISPLVQTNVRYGVEGEFRSILSKNSAIETGGVYLNESWRDGKDLGTNTSGINDPDIKENRFGGYLFQNWNSTIGESAVPVQLISDGHYTSDSLVLREYDGDSNIGEYNSRFLVSTMNFRVPMSQSLVLDVIGEYNQSLVSNQDVVFQRAPEAILSSTNFFDPFGDNFFGLKVNSLTQGSTVNFVRDEGYNGSRQELYQNFRMPFHIKNFVDSQLEVGARGNIYAIDSLSNSSDDQQTDCDDDDDDCLKRNSTRFVPDIKLKVGSALEKVYEVDSDSWIKNVLELGPSYRTEGLTKIKHTVEPGLRYRYIPSVNQNENPLFDSTDRMVQRNVATYSLTQRIFGRFEPRNKYLYGIEEAAPDVEALGSLRESEQLDRSFAGGLRDPNEDNVQRLRVGNIRELLTFKILQSFDINEARNDEDPENDEFSDVAADLILYPNDYLYFRTRADYSTNTADFSDYTVESGLEDKRGDRLRGRFRFVSEQITQFESNLELVITDWVKLGFYGRYDMKENEFIDNRMGFRYISDCKCWMADLTYSEQINPDRNNVYLTFTLNGLGEFGQRITGNRGLNSTQ